MTVLSDYTSGTISLAQGSVTVTGTGTLFEVTNFREGDTLQIQNLTAVIASVNSDTSLTLAEPWTGTSIVNGAYRARQLGDVSRYPTQAATIIELLGNGVLSSIAEIPVQAGKLLIGNSAGGYDPIDQSEIGGVPDPNGSVKKLADIELGNHQILQTDETGNLITIALASDKFLRTDANGDIALSDLGSLGEKLVARPDTTSGQAQVRDDIGAGTHIHNWIINGDFTVNQRGGVKKPANGIYGFDRWKGHANGIEQIIEALAAGEYTLTWTGGGTGTFGGTTAASPIKTTVSGGNTSVVVPQAATKVSLVIGDATARDPWQGRPIGQELLLCQRYAEFVEAKAWLMTTSAGSVVGVTQSYLVEKRISPTVIPIGESFTYCNLVAYEPATTRIGIPVSSTQSGPLSFQVALLVDAEI